MKGARWVQSEILSENHDADLKVFVIWEPMLRSDNRERWDRGLIDDSRAVHYWDQQKISGKWFTAHLPDCRSLGNTAWDVFYLFDGEAAWAEELDSPTACGAPVIKKQQQLQEGFDALGADEPDRAKASLP